MSFFTRFTGGLSGPVGNGLITHGADVIKTRHALKTLGYYDGKTDLEYTDPALDHSIRQFQQEKGLRVDGRLFPGGETEREINRTLLTEEGVHTKPAPGTLQISDEVGNNRTNRRRDVRRVQTALSGLGVLPSALAYEANGLIDHRTEDGIRTFQRNNNLREDGMLRPGGETERTLNALIRLQSDERGSDGTDGGDTPPLPEPKPEPPPPPPAEEAPEDKPEKPDKPDETPPEDKPEKPDNDCSDLESAVEKAQQAYDDAAEKLEAAEEEKAAIQETIQAQLDKVETLESNLETLQSQLEKIDNTIQKEKRESKNWGRRGRYLGMMAGTRFPNKGSAIRWGGKIGDVGGRVLEEGLDAITDEKMTSTLKDERTAIVQQIEEIQQEIAAIRNEIAEPLSKIDALESEINESLQPAADNLQSDLEELQGALENCQNPNIE